MGKVLGFPDRPLTTLQDLQRDLSDALGKITHSALSPEPLRNVSIGTTSTAVAHGIKGIPSFIHVLQTSTGGPVFQSAPSDGRFVYLQSVSGQVSVTLMFVP